jgi:hypothetical protein
MKKHELKALIKECYLEVLKEGQSQLPAPKPEFPDEPVSADNPMLSSDEIIKRRLAGAKLSAEMMKILKDIHADPKTIAAIDAIKKRNFDVEPERFPGAN